MLIPGQDDRLIEKKVAVVGLPPLLVLLIMTNCGILWNEIPIWVRQHSFCVLASLPFFTSAALLPLICHPEQASPKVKGVEGSVQWSNYSVVTHKKTVWIDFEKSLSLCSTWLILRFRSERHSLSALYSGWHVFRRKRGGEWFSKLNMPPLLVILATTNCGILWNEIPIWVRQHSFSALANLPFTTPLTRPCHPE